MRAMGQEMSSDNKYELVNPSAAPAPSFMDTIRSNTHHANVEKINSRNDFIRSLVDPVRSPTFGSNKSAWLNYIKDAVEIASLRGRNTVDVLVFNSSNTYFDTLKVMLKRARSDCAVDEYKKWIYDNVIQILDVLKSETGMTTCMVDAQTCGCTANAHISHGQSIDDLSIKINW